MGRGGILVCMTGLLFLIFLTGAVSASLSPTGVNYEGLSHFIRFSFKLFCEFSSLLLESQALKWPPKLNSLYLRFYYLLWMWYSISIIILFPLQDIHFRLRNKYTYCSLPNLLMVQTDNSHRAILLALFHLILRSLAFSFFFGSFWVGERMLVYLSIW